MKKNSTEEIIKNILRLIRQAFLVCMSIFAICFLLIKGNELQDILLSAPSIGIACLSVGGFVGFLVGNLSRFFKDSKVIEELKETIAEKDNTINDQTQKLAYAKQFISPIIKSRQNELKMQNHRTEQERVRDMFDQIGDFPISEAPEEIHTTEENNLQDTETSSEDEA